MCEAGMTLGWQPLTACAAVVSLLPLSTTFASELGEGGGGVVLLLLTLACVAHLCLFQWHWCDPQ